MSDLQRKIIEEMHVQSTIDPIQEIRTSIDFIKDYAKANPFLKTFVLGISGGQDSTLVGKLAQLAVDELRMETNNDAYQFIGVRLPYGEQSDEQDAKDAMTWIQPDRSLCVNIRPSVDACVKSLLDSGLPLSDFTEGNVKARMRMIVQYAIAGEEQGVVLGTDHAAESVTGFFTKFGDGASDLLPIFRLNKRQGKAMLQQLGAPEHLLSKVPIADLEDNKPGQPDEEALGVSYQEIDDYLEGRPISKEAADKIETWYRQSKHKRHLPITPFDSFWKTGK